MNDVKQSIETIYTMVKELRELEMNRAYGSLEELELLEHVLSYFRDEVADRFIAEAQFKH